MKYPGAFWRQPSLIRPLIGKLHCVAYTQVALSDDTFVRAKRRLVVAAGAWTPEVLRGLGVDLAVEIHSVAWGHYEVRYPISYLQPSLCL